MPCCGKSSPVATFLSLRYIRKMGSPRPVRKNGGKLISAGRQCQVVGPGLEGGVCGVASVIQIRCRTSGDAPVTMGGDIVNVSITPVGGNTTHAHVIDNTDGSYTATYLPTIASPNCKVLIQINGTHVVGSPFSAQVTPGPTNALVSSVYGRGLYDGVAGQPCTFTIMTKDTYRNRCTLPGDQFSVTVKPIHSLLPELQTFLRKYELKPQLEDNEDGTHSVTFTPEYAGFYMVDVTLGSQPVGDAPFMVCVSNPYVAFPSILKFTPLVGDATHAPPEGASCPPARDMVQVLDRVLVLKSESLERTGGRPQREYLHAYKLKSVMARGNEMWRRALIRSQLPSVAPPPYRRVCLALPTKILALCHADTDGDQTQITEARTLEVSDPDADPIAGWTLLQLEGKAPKALDGYAAAMWEGKGIVLMSGGQIAGGATVSDVWMLSLPGTGSTAAVWRCLAEWPSSVFSGEGMGERRNHSMTFRPGCDKDGKPYAQFWIFGGRSSDDELLNTLFVFDMEEQAWSQPSVVGDAPEPREHHAACFVAERYLAIYGGFNETGDVLDSMAVYDIFKAEWSTVTGMAARAQHRLCERGGTLYAMGGVDASKHTAPSIPLSAPMNLFSQQACLDFEGNSGQAVIVKPSPSLQELRKTWTVECIFYPRMRSQSPGFQPLIVKSDGGLKTGFGLVTSWLPTPALKFPTGRITPLAPESVPPEPGPWVMFFVGGMSLPTMVGGKLELNAWNHVAATYDGAKLRIYINGAAPVESESSEPLACIPTVDFPADAPMTDEIAETFHTKGDVCIGGIKDKLAFDGKIDMCRLWDVVRTEDEIKANMNTTYSHPITQHLLGQWTFNEGSGETVIDSGGARNHGSFERYAGGVELRRVMSDRGTIAPYKSASERYIEEQYDKLHAWKKKFHEDNGRAPGMADMMLAGPEIAGIARRLGEFGIEFHGFKEEKPQTPAPEPEPEPE